MVFISQINVMQLLLKRKLKANKKLPFWKEKCTDYFWQTLNLFYSEVVTRHKFI